MYMRFGLSSAVTALAAGAVALLAFPVLAQQPGEPVCVKCHAESYTGLAETKHGAKSDPRSPFGSGRECQACHGDATEHLKNPRKNPLPVRFGKGEAAAADQTQACMNCHGGNRHLVFWDSGRHSRNDVRCNDCHAVHAKPPRGSTMAFTVHDPKVSPFVTTERQLEYETCIACHKQTRAQILKPNHHPIVEGKITCSNCHNPHGAQSHAMVKHETVNAQCTSCHADKRGPFLFEHPAVEENCLSCHAPHGSSHTKLLTEKVPNLCQDCHDWSRHPGTAYAGNQGFPPGAANTRFIARACLNCHNAIHGSNAPATRGRYLTR
jgi:DmsE family decaheme c-type cytochrome